MNMLRELNFFLGLQVKQLDNGIFINQAKYTKELLKKFGMKSRSSINVLMGTSIRLDKDEDRKDVDITKFRRLIGYLLYLTASKLDIVFAIRICVRFQSAPKETHMLATKESSCT